MPQTLAQLVRSKHPGDYDDLSDQALEKAVRAKYPGDYDDLPSTTDSGPSPKAQPIQDKAPGSFALGDVATVEKPAQPFGSLGIQTVTDEQWKAMTPKERLNGLLTAAGKGLASTFGMGEGGREMVDNPKTALATAALGVAVPAALGAIPTRAKAGAKFAEVMKAAHDVPIDISKPGAAALRIQELADRGATMPQPVRKFLLRITDPTKAEMTYEEGRDFASNISRLSANEMTRLSPTVAREVHSLRAALNGALESAAGKVDKAKVFRDAMSQYRRASQIRDVATKTGKEVAKGAAAAAGLGAAYKILGN